MVTANKAKLLLLMFIFLIGWTLTGCGSQSKGDQKEDGNLKETDESTADTYPTVDENPTVTITMANDNQIKLELYPDVAPNTVSNFISLINQGFYDGLTFHRVIPEFMIQGGDPEGNGTGGPGYAIKGEFTSNGFDNNLKHERGVLSMARSNDPDSAGSQFFIMVADSSQLDGDYAAFGKVTDGMDVVDNIVSVDRDGNDKPKEEQKMKKVTVDTHGYDFPKPDTEKTE
ncbi:peptidylprolyl isomerase [Lentibacillus sp. N15]|uniref:peptidylprolyl isomerase n=1 Tax=Lentibacillus songyuanensis TaxID=3136161 RepID=UPI0031B9EC44